MIGTRDPAECLASPTSPPALPFAPAPTRVKFHLEDTVISPGPSSASSVNSSDTNLASEDAGRDVSSPIASEKLPGLISRPESTVVKIPPVLPLTNTMMQQWHLGVLPSGDSW
ncbi:hypothetical protein FS749_009619 [Ceratobasidium sp. UAMH 11750]|nr:hypothetical protein FS749_009619 [Ceratobasidium sp. UAMH 11750]